jgi:predicted Zn-dependent protease
MKSRMWFGALTLAALCGCQSVETTQGGAVGIERRQSMSPLVSSAQMDRSATEAYAQVLSDARKKDQLNHDPAQVARVRAVANRLIPSTAAFRADAPGWKWEVNVITTQEVNAWCMPGGKIAVYTGLMSQLKLTDDELAAVMGHEIGHALREHGRERASEQMTRQLGVQVLSVLTGINLENQLTDVVLNVTLSLPHSRTQETEADRIGVELAARSGYDPRAAVSLWQKMGNLGGGKPPEWLSTHPSDQTRTRDVQSYAERVMPLYDASRAR